MVRKPASIFASAAYWSGATSNGRTFFGRTFFLEVVVDIEAGALQTAKAIYAIRRRRDSAAGFRGLFGEPAWDILLELYIAQKSRTELQVSSVCIEAGVPSTTILRWIARLERDGLVYREADRGDARRRYVRLTSEGHALMVRLLGAIGPMG